MTRVVSWIPLISSTDLLIERAERSQCPQNCALYDRDAGGCKLVGGEFENVRRNAQTVLAGLLLSDPSLIARLVESSPQNQNCLAEVSIIQSGSNEFTLSV